MHNLVVSPSDDLPVARFSGVRRDEVAHGVRLPAVDHRVDLHGEVLLARLQTTSYRITRKNRKNRKLRKSKKS